MQSRISTLYNILTYRNHERLVWCIENPGNLKDRILYMGLSDARTWYSFVMRRKPDERDVGGLMKGLWSSEIGLLNCCKDLIRCSVKGTRVDERMGWVFLDDKPGCKLRARMWGFCVRTGIDTLVKREGTKKCSNCFAISKYYVKVPWDWASWKLNETLL